MKKRIIEKKKVTDRDRPVSKISVKHWGNYQIYPPKKKQSQIQTPILH